MQIINAESPRSPQQTAGRGGYRVDSVVWHHTAGGSVPGLISYFQSNNNSTCPHYLVGQDGSIHRLVSEANTAWHAGDWPRNCRSVGIENQHDTGGPWSAAIEASLKALTADICRRLGIPQTRAHILGHSQIVNTRCPDNLPIDRWVAELGGAAPAPTPPPAPGGPYDWQRHNDGQAQTVVLPRECYARWNGAAGSWWRGQTRVRGVTTGEWAAWRLAHLHGGRWYLLDDQRTDSYGLWVDDACMDTRPCGGSSPPEVARAMGGQVI